MKEKQSKCWDGVESSTLEFKLTSLFANWSQKCLITFVEISQIVPRRAFFPINALKKLIAKRGFVFLQSCSMHFDIYSNVNKKHENASCKYPHAFRGKHIVFGFKPTAQGQTAVQTDTSLSDISCRNGTIEQRHLLRKNLWDSLFPMSDRNWLGISTWHDVNAEYWSC